MRIFGVAESRNLKFVISVLHEDRQSWLRRKLVLPILRLLRRGATPERLAWSLTIGVIIGINPILGSTTVITIALTHLLKLNHPASQIGVHGAGPLQIALLLPLLHAGAVVFKTEDLPLHKDELLHLAHQHPATVVRSLWTWEWHALVVWLGCSVVLAPAMGLLMTRVLRRAMREQRVAEMA